MSDKPPIQYFENFLTAQEAALLENVVWNQTPWEKRDDAPRKELWLNPYDMPYTYGSGERARTYEANNWNDSITGWIASGLLFKMHLNELPLSASLDCCFINGYDNEKHHLGWHSDDSPEMDHEHPIAVLSLGAVRELWVRPKGFSGVIPPEYRFPLGSGSLFVMEAGMQRTWEHRIPKHHEPCGPRMSFTYRRLIRVQDNVG